MKVFFCFVFRTVFENCDWMIYKVNATMHMDKSAILEDITTIIIFVLKN